MAIPTPPAPRLAYDIDGSVVVISRTASNDHNPFEADYLTKASLNTNFSTGLAIGPNLWDIPAPATEYYAKNWIAVVFPRSMDIKAWMMSARVHTSKTPIIVTYTSITPAYVELQVSNDTTNGQDGTWTTVAFKDEYDYTIPWRNNGSYTSPPHEIGAPSSVGELIGNPHDLMFQDEGPDGPGWMPISGADNVKAIRVYFPRRSVITDADPDFGLTSGGFRSMLMAMHLYGEPSAGSEKRLDLVDGDGTGWADLAVGNMGIGKHVTRTVRVRNASASQDAIDVRLTAEGGIPSWFPRSHFALQFSLDGQEWLPSVRLGDIPAGELSPEVSVRVAPIPGMVGLHFARIRALAGEWS